MQSGLGCKFSLVLLPLCVLVCCAVCVLLLLFLCVLHVLQLCTMLVALLLVNGEGEGKWR